MNAYGWKIFFTRKPLDFSNIGIAPVAGKIFLINLSEAPKCFQNQ